MYKQQYGRSSERDEYRTPDWVYKPLNEVFGFTLDAAATPTNTKVYAKYYTKSDNGLIQDWSEDTVFVNPPFSDGQYGDWIDKACMEYLHNTVTTVLVLPFNPETKAFRDVWDFAKYLIIPRKRISFLSPSGEEKTGATFPTCVVAFTYRTLKLADLAKLSSLGYILNLHNAFAI